PLEPSPTETPATRHFPEASFVSRNVASTETSATADESSALSCLTVSGPRVSGSTLPLPLLLSLLLRFFFLPSEATACSPPSPSLPSAASFRALHSACRPS